MLDYIVWFLKHKYLRYIKKSETEKGKRKAMKKELYLRFKNEVMLPYMLDLREQIHNNHNWSFNALSSYSSIAFFRI